MAIKTMIESIRETMEIAMESDPSIVLIGEDVGALGGVFRASEGLQERFGRERVVDMPLAEGVIVGAGIGLAVAGLRPIVEIQFLGFGHQAFHQLCQQMARFRFRSRGRFGLPIVVRAPFGGGVRTPELHSDAFEALYTQVPGLKVVAPSTARDAKGLLLSALHGDDPVLFLEPLKGYRLVKDEVPDGDFRMPLGEAGVVREGSDLTIIAWSASTQLAVVAAEKLAASGIEAQVVDLRSLVPLDTATIRRAVAATGRALIVHEAPLTGGFGAEVVATIQEECFYDLLAPVVRVTAPDTPYPLAGVEEHYVPNERRVFEAARELMATAP